MCFGAQKPEGSGLLLRRAVAWQSLGRLPRRPGKGDRELTLDLLVGRKIRPHPGATWMSSRDLG